MVSILLNCKILIMDCSFNVSEFPVKAWYNSLPKFLSHHDLKKSEWNTYITNIYGTKLNFPLDIRCFTFFYMEKLPYNWLPIFNEKFRPDNSSKFYDGDVVTTYGRKNHVNIYRYSQTTIGLKNVMTYADNQRLEVFHYGSDCYKNDKTPLGYWMMFTPGSGIFFNLKKTIYFNDGYDAACRYFKGSDSLCKQCCKPVHTFLIKKARERNIDSIQIRGSRPGGGRIRRYELFSTRNNCNTRDVCPKEVELTKYNGEPCICNSSFGYTNCI